MNLSIMIVITIICAIISLANADCGPHEVNVTCPTPCPPTCENPIPPICPLFCLQFGCICEPGFIRREPGGPCIPECSCRGNCGPHEVNVTCPNPCEPTCANPIPPKVCTRPCRRFGCVCAQGYIRKFVGGPCIKKCSCGNLCGPLEVCTQCEQPCQPTCQDPNRPTCIPIICGHTDCVCKPGFIRETDGGNCINRKNCPV